MSLTKKIILLWSACILVIAAASFYFYKTSHKLIDDLSGFTQNYQIENTLNSMLTLLVDAETGQRGYLLTSKKSYLEPYYESIKKLSGHITALERLTADNPKHQKQLAVLKQLIAIKLDELRATINLHRKGSSSEAFSIVQTDHGKQAMDDIRVVIKAMLLDVQTLLNHRLDSSSKTITYTSNIISAGSLFVLFIVSLIALFMISGARHFVNKASITESRLRETANRDSLTRLTNRRGLIRQFDNAIKTSLHYEQSLSVIMIDLDHFKFINDTYGHDAGDIVLKNVAQILHNSIRKCDIAARFGGEEFVVILTDTSLAEAEEFAERLLKRISSNKFNIQRGKDIKMTASIGIACFPEDEISQKALLNKADIAMYHAKLSGRNQVKNFNANPNDALIK